MRSIEEIKQQEELLQFEQFDNNSAIEIGNELLKMARKSDLQITIDISRCRQQLFHAAMEGTSTDNDEWLKRKVNTVYHFAKSSFLMQKMLKEEGKTLEEAYFLSPNVFACAGGAFPVYLKNTGMIGTIAVSGLTDEEDHNLIVECLKVYLKK